MKKAGFIVMGLLVATLMLFTACQPAAKTVVEGAPTEGATAEETAATEVPAVEVVKGGTITLTEAGIVQFDPPFINDDASNHVASLVHVYLFRTLLDPEGNSTVIPELAKSWDFEEDGKVIVFHLNEGWKFQDGNDIFADGEGREITAEDVAYSIDRMVTIEGSSSPSDLVTHYVSAEALDTYTVKLTLTEPDAILFASGRGLSSTAILPKEAVEARGDQWGLKPIGGGPFEFVEYVADDHVTLRKNEDYTIEPNIDEVIFRIIPDETTQVISLEAGEVDQLQIPAAEFERFQNDENYKLYRQNCPYSYHIQFDQKNPIFQDVKVRQAMSHAVDGRAIMKNEFGGMWVDGCGVAGPGIPGYDATLCELFAYDPALSEQLMTEAGYTRNAEGIWEKDGQAMSMELEVWNMTPAPSIATAATTQLKEAGFNVTMVEVEFGTWIEDAMGENTQKPLMMWSGFCGEGGLDGFYNSTGLAPAWGYSNQEVWDLFTAANVMIDPVERQATLQSATRKIYETYPDIPFGFATGYEITSKRVQDWVVTMWWSNLVTSANNVWLSK